MKKKHVLLAAFATTMLNRPLLLQILGLRRLSCGKMQMY